MVKSVTNQSVSVITHQKHILSCKDCKYLQITPILNFMPYFIDTVNIEVFYYKFNLTKYMVFYCSNQKLIYIKMYLRFFFRSKHHMTCLRRIF